MLRSVVARTLRHQGYTVLEAASGHEAQQVFLSWEGAPIRLLLTSVVLPQISGLELELRLRTRDPALGVLYISGYPEQVLAGYLHPVTDISLLPTPFLPETLRRRVRGALEQSQVP